MSALPALSFGALLRHHRLAAGLTQEQLAERAGVSPRAVIALERGERRRPHGQTIQLLAAALHLTGRDLEILEQAAGYTPSALEHPEGAADVQATPFVGRVKELESIDRFLGNARPAVLLFAGEPGIGKSRLLDEAAGRGRARGFTVFRGGGHRRSGQEPYTPLLETLARSLTAIPATRLRAVLTGCGWLARLLPELVEIVSAPLPTGALAPEQERRLTFGAAARYLANVAGPSGTLLLLDDLQWASPDGLDLLTSLLRSSTSASIRIVGAYRDTEVSQDHPLSATLTDLAEHDLAEQVNLEPLADGEVVELLDALLSAQRGTPRDGVVRGEIVRHAGGLPFFLVSYAQGLAGASPEGQSRSRVPWNVAQSIRQRIAALPQGAQRVLEAAAVADRTIERRVLLEMDLGAEPEVLGGLDAACRARLLVLEGERTYQFSHDVIREVIEAGLGSGQRALLHRSVGEALERLPERSRRAAELAWHFLEADVPERALHYSLGAGDEAVGVFAHAEAAQHYGTAVRAAREVGDVVREAQALEKLGWVLWTVGRYDEALGALDRAAEMQHRAGNLDAEGQIAAKIGWALSQAGKPEEGISRLQIAVERLEDEGPSPALVALYNALVHLFVRQGRTQDIITAAERASALAGVIGDDHVWVQGELNREMALSLQGRFDDALRVLEDLIPVAERVGDNETLGRALIHAASMYAAQGEIDRSRTYRERLVDLRQRTSSPDRVANALTLLGDLLAVQGDWTQAREHYERAADMTSALTSHQAGWARQSFARLCLVEGKWQDADTYLEQCMSIIERTEDRGSVPGVQALLAQRDLLQGKTDAAVVRLESLLDQYDLDHDLLLVLAEGYVGTGHAVRADEVITHGVQQAMTQNNRLALADWKRLQGALRTEQGRWEEAEGALEEALSLASAMPYPYATARASYEWGRLRARQGELGEARGRLQEALAIFQMLGARPDADRTERALAGLSAGRPE